MFILSEKEYDKSGDSEWSPKPGERGISAKIWNLCFPNSLMMKSQRVNTF